jgi:YD repeat-containing protein
VTTVYDAAGQKIARWDARLNRTTMAYDGAGRLVQRICASASGTGDLCLRRRRQTGRCCIDSTGRYSMTYGEERWLVRILSLWISRLPTFLVFQNDEGINRIAVFF